MFSNTLDFSPEIQNITENTTTIIIFETDDV